MWLTTRLTEINERLFHFHLYHQGLEQFFCGKWYLSGKKNPLILSAVGNLQKSERYLLSGVANSENICWTA